MKEQGILIGSPNIQPEIQKYSETANWEYREQASFLYGVGAEMMDRFFNGLVYKDGRTIPNPVFAFKDLRNRKVLAQYDLHPDEYGIKFKITINTAHYEDVDGKKEYKYGKWTLSEITLHELIHVWQQEGGGKDPYISGRNTHNKEFVDKAEVFGLHPAPVAGWHTRVADADKPFGILMYHLGISRPNDVPRADGAKGNYFQDRERKGRSSLSKWSCGCQNAWIGAAEYFAHCDKCGNEFVKATALRETLKELAAIDVNGELDRIQEQFREKQEQALQDEMDRWEDLGMYMDQYGDMG